MVFTLPLEADLIFAGMTIISYIVYLVPLKIKEFSRKEDNSFFYYKNNLLSYNNFIQYVKLHFLYRICVKYALILKKIRQCCMLSKTQTCY